MCKEKSRDLLHFISAHIEYFRPQMGAAIRPHLDEHQSGIPLARVIVVSAERRNVKAFLKQVAKSGEHFHLKTSLSSIKPNFGRVQSKSVATRETSAEFFDKRMAIPGECSLTRCIN
jgi:hypothetical protein